MPSAFQTERNSITLIRRSPREWVRAGEPEYRQAGLTPEASDQTILAAMARFPVLIERPILILPDGAVVGRPPDRVLKLLDGDL